MAEDVTTIAWWMPHYAYRFYQKDGTPDFLVFIAVILDDLENPSLVKEPFVTAGWLQYDKNIPPDIRTWEWRYCMAILENGHPVLDGSLVDVDVGKFRKNRIIASKAMALPLVEIQNVEELIKMVLLPLIQKRQGVKA